MTATRIRLCRVSAVSPDQPVAVNLHDRPSLGVYQVDDAYYVNENLCTHGHALLTDGYQEGPYIQCPLHGGMFDVRSGIATAYPCQIPIRNYPTLIEDGWICIDVDGGEVPV